ncbi:GGDEF domain-containing protein [Roseibium hamelinense]|nr:GGDEF domain-containing protein [Roseibium hamelinense]
MDADPHGLSTPEAEQDQAMLKAGGKDEADFTLFDEEDRILLDAEAALDNLTHATGLVKSLSRAYKRAVRDQKRMVRLCDRMQEELISVKEKLQGEVKARAELAEQFRIMATTDALTGVFSRGHFLDLCGYEVNGRKRTLEPLAIAVLDVDHFKSVNDTHGHAGGDKALQEITETLRCNLRPSDSIGRIGGEEFGILMPATHAENAERLAERLRRLVAETPIETEKTTFKVTASFGVCALEGALPDRKAGEADPVAKIINAADEALYEAKENGRNQVILTRMPASD